MDNTKDLQRLRQEIDTIDDKIHTLLIQRTQLANNISKAKGKQTGLAIRPAREAFIHRRLFKNHQGDFPFASLARMWREMINAFTLLQSNYTLAVYAPQDDLRCWEVARDQFGSVVKMVAYETEQQTIQQAENCPYTIAIVPAVGLFHIKDTRAILRLPFSGQCMTYAGEYDVYAVAQITPEPSESDYSIYKGNPDDNPVTANKDMEILATENGQKDCIYAVKGFYEDAIGVYPAQIEAKQS